MDKNETKTIRLAVSSFSLAYGAMFLGISYYYRIAELNVWLLPLAADYFCLAFLFWPHKYHREKIHAALFGAAVYFIHLTAILLLFYSLYAAGSSLNVTWGFVYVS